jgi:hypothetical protein
MNANSDALFIARTLLLTSVPSFAYYKDGKLQSTLTSSDKQKIEEALATIVT